MTSDLTFYEFFAGGGLARIGLGSKWECLFANDIDEKKAQVYQRNFHEGHELIVDDVNRVTSAMLPDQALLAWASFPCQDLSLAGNGQRRTVYARDGQEISQSKWTKLKRAR
jgi:DNA (cytosine-5)-methyltransferase 1